MRPSRRLVAFCSLAVMAAGACGPDTSVDIGVRAAAVNLNFGDPKAKKAAPVLDVPITGPGFVAPPVRLDLPTDLPAAPLHSRPRTGPLKRACPTAKAGTGAEEAAPASVTAPPKPGLYSFRRTGHLAVGGTGAEKQPLSEVVVQEVANVLSVAAPGDATAARISFDVIQTEPGLRTTTSYVIDPAGVALDPRASGGLKIAKIVVERADLPGDALAGIAGVSGVETFEPQPPVKIMNLPAALEPVPTDASMSSRGVDATTGAVMEVFSATQERVSVDVCGRVIQGFRVRVSFNDPTYGPRASSYQRPEVRGHTFSGDFVFAPQFALIVHQSLTFVGTDVGGVPFELHSTSTINNVEPA